MGLGEFLRESYYEAEKCVRYGAAILRNPKAMGCGGSISRWVRRRLVQLAPPGTDAVLDIGTGAGDLPRDLLCSGRIPPHGKVGAIERDARLAHFARRRIRDERFDIVHGDACDLVEHCNRIFGPGKKVKRIYWTVPFRVLLDHPEILETMLPEVLDVNGRFIVCIYLNAREALTSVFRQVRNIPLHGILSPPLPPYQLQIARDPRMNGALIQART